MDDDVTSEDASYIIVHALNLEGIEIASIEGMAPHCVGVYDGDTLIGHSAHNEETCNQPIAISHGAHTIKVVFNGIELNQNINIQEGETIVITFTFSRTIYDLISEIPTCNLHSHISGSWSGKTSREDDTDNHP
jgi:hypothetical protein